MCGSKNTSLLFGGRPGLYGELTAYQNILYHAELRGLKAADAKAHIARYADLLDMSDILHRQVNEMSTGMRQKNGDRPRTHT